MRGHKHTVIAAYNAFNMKFEVESRSAGGVLGGDNTVQAIPEREENLNKRGTPQTQNKAKTRSRVDRGMPPKPRPRDGRAKANDARKREAEAAVWGASRMQSEKQLRGVT